MKAARIPVAVAIVSLVAAGSVFADRTLWLQTDEGMLEVPLKPGQNMSVLADGNVSAVADDEFVCSLDDGASCEDVEVALSGSFSSFSVSPGTITQGGSVTISWRSRGAWECVGSGLPGTTWNSANPRMPEGSTTVNTSNLNADTTYSIALECSNGPVKATRTVSLSVTEPDSGGPESCSDRPTLSHIEGWSRATDTGGSGDPNFYTQIFPGNSFPGTSNNFLFYLDKGRYAAMKFTVPQSLNNQSGGWRVVPVPSGSPSAAGRMFATLSRCPGDFDVATFDDPMCGRIASSSEGWIRTRWTTDPNDTDIRNCYLEPGETYYFNVLYTTTSASPLDFPPVQSDCGGQTRCGHELQRALN